MCSFLRGPTQSYKIGESAQLVISQLRENKQNVWSR